MIGLIALGHSPRPDHEAVYQQMAPDVPRQLTGALDSLSPEQARGLEDKKGQSPLVCLLSDSSTVEIPLPTLFPYLEEKVHNLAQNGASMAVILCCGGFPQFNCSIPVLLPGMIVPSLVSCLYPDKKIGIVVPNKAQEDAARTHWKTMGINVVTAVVSPYEGKGFEAAGRHFKSAACDLVAIDCMGFSQSHRDRLHTLCDCPVLLPKTMVARVAQEIYTSSVNSKF